MKKQEWFKSLDDVKKTKEECVLLSNCMLYNFDCTEEVNKLNTLLEQLSNGESMKFAYDCFAEYVYQKYRADFLHRHDYGLETSTLDYLHDEDVI